MTDVVDYAWHFNLRTGGAKLPYRKFLTPGEESWRYGITNSRITRLPEPIQPSVLQLTRTYSKLPDALSLVASGNFMDVSEKMRDVIEELEPGVHQFLPYEVYDKHGEPWPERFFFLHILQRADALLVDKSTGIGRRTDFGPGATKPFHLETSSGLDDALTYDRNVVGSWHLWRQSGRTVDMMMMSAELRKRIESHKIKGLYFTRVLLG